MSEKELQALVIDLARWNGYLHMHITDSRKSAGVGFPDLVLVHQRTGHLLFVELKSATGKLSDGQVAWLDALRAGGHRAVVWRPLDWQSGLIKRDLEQGTHPRAVAS